MIIFHVRLQFKPIKSTEALVPKPLYRTAKFEVVPSSEQLAALIQMSEVMRRIWNLAVEERESVYTKHLAPIYEAIKTADKAGDHDAVEELKQQLLETMKEHPLSAMSQGKNLLTPLRRADPSIACVTRKWQEGTLFDLEGAMKSYFKLKKNGDPKARRPRAKPEGWFQEITCKGGFKLSADMSSITLPCRKVAPNDVMTFPIPEYQQEQLRSGVVRKFTLYRDERKLDEPGRYWMSISYAMEAPAEQPIQISGPAGNIVYLALGSTAIAVLAPPVKGENTWREELIMVPRPDKYWKPQIDAVSARMKRLYREDRETQSRRYKKLRQARKTMFAKLKAQQTKCQRELVSRLLELGGNLHFVVTKLVVRSKLGKLADGKNPERRGTLGKNWATQNTGWLTGMLAWLKIKTSERGSTVRTFKVEPPHPRNSNFAERKAAMARLLRERYATR